MVAASSLYACCRQRQMPAPLKELARTSGLSPAEIGRCYRSIVAKMDVSMPPFDEESYVRKVAERAHKSDEAVRLSLAMIRRAAERGLGGSQPMSMAAAALYVACLSTGEGANQAALADAAGVGVLSVRNLARMLRKTLDARPIS